MRTTSKVFAGIFFIGMICALVAGVSGATHQYFSAVVCGVFWIALTAEASGKEVKI